MRSLGYFFKESLHGFTRNLSTTLGSIVTIFLSLLIIGIFLVGGVVVNNVMSSVENEVGISAFISDDASQSDIDKVEDFIRGIDGVASVDFTTKDQALENFKATSNSDIVDALDGQNPLPASIEVELSDPKLVEDVASQIEQNSTFASICGYDSPSESLKYGQKSVAQLFQLTSYVRYIGIALIVLLIFIALVFINNTIRLAILARRKEIASCASSARRTVSSAGPSSWKVRCMQSSARCSRSACSSFCATWRCRSSRERSSSSRST